MRFATLTLLVLTLGACGGSDDTADSDGGETTSATGKRDGGSGRPSSDAAARADSARHPRDAFFPTDVTSFDAPSALVDSARDGGTDSAPVCTTRITYGATWIHGTSHAAQYDVVDGAVTWDGSCTASGANSYATLSNGWQPYFTGASGCILALDYSAGCPSPPACTTRVSYGSAWLPPANHPGDYDDIAGRVFSDGTCDTIGSMSQALLSNGWAPTFDGAGACALSFRYEDCGGLYANPVIPVDCPDPGVLAVADGYVLSCTSGDDADAFPIYTSPDLVNWTSVGHIFPSGHRPTWAASDFWAPEIHTVGGHYVAYFTARDTAGMLSVGVASSTSPLGPFTDIGAPLVSDATMGHIDSSEINAADGTPYMLWKDDGNAIGKPTPIHAQQLSADGLALVGSAATLITNDQPWEGAVTEAPFMVNHGGTYFLFYSGNSYANTSYAVGVASSSSPMGPFTKASGPILVSNGAWAGPGHCAVVDTAAGDTYMVYAAWEASAVNADPGRLDLVDAISWTGAYPSVPLAPSSTSRPLP